MTREDRAREFYGEHCEIPLPWMHGSVQNQVKDIIAAMLAFADSEIQRAAPVISAQWRTPSGLPDGTEVEVRERDGSETPMKVGSLQWRTALADLGTNMAVRPTISTTTKHTQGEG